MLTCLSIKTQNDIKMKKEIQAYGMLTCLSIVMIGLSFGCGGEEKALTKYEVQTITEDGYTYEIVPNDDLQLRIYTLGNGLKVYMSVNKDEPRIQTVIGVRAGSSYDPAETTGLAHYLEHMVFKGTDRMGTLDWEQESLLIQQIEDLYEAHRATDDVDEKRRIYGQIDSVSNIAATYAIANEYDKMSSSIGAKGTNAFTSTEVTAYINDIPSNEFEKWLMLEQERFRNLVLRLFHTELEAVYEEFNRGQDNDRRKVYRELLKALYPGHTYGTQTTIGTSEHLKNPSMVKIREYFDTYYVANNMVLCLAGDINPKEDIKMIDKYFGKMRSGEVPAHEPTEAGPINGPKVVEVMGPDQESVNIGFRFGPKNSHDNYMVELIDLLLNNAQAGIIDLDLVQQQKLLRGGSYPNFQSEYGSHTFWGAPREGQSLTEVKDLLLSALDKVKKGEFGDWLIPAVINDMELSRIEGSASNYVAYEYLDVFINNISWVDYLERIDRIAKISKEEVIAFANERYTDDHVVIYKRIGVDTTIAKVSNPAITPLSINRVDESAFMQEFTAMTKPSLEPVFVDYKSAIQRTSLNSGVELSYIENTTNELFTLNYILDMGREHNKKLPLAVKYLPYLGTDKYSASELQEEFYKLGLRMNVSASSNRTYVSIEGLEKSADAGVELLEHILENVKADQEAYDDYVDGIMKKRADSKLNKGNIMFRGMRSYGIYGPHSAFTDIIPEEDLRSQNPNELVEIIKGLCDYEHFLFYYGQNSMADAARMLNRHHKENKELLEYPPVTKYEPLDTDKNLVYFVNYDMVQTEIMVLAKDEQFNAALMPYARLYGSYFGSGLSSIMFQEIREAKGLAYTARSSYSTPSLPDRHHYMTAYVGTQVNKLSEAVPAMMAIINDMPESENMFDASKKSILKKIETERLTKTSIFWSYLANKRRGINHDVRQDIYEKVQTLNMSDLRGFIESHIKKEHYVYLVIGNRDDIDMEFLQTLGEFRELTLEEIFGY